MDAPETSPQSVAPLEVAPKGCEHSWLYLRAIRRSIGLNRNINSMTRRDVFYCSKCLEHREV